MKFSIVCLTYKRIELLQECIYSVLQQTHGDWELLVINDYSIQTLHYNHLQVRIFNLKEKFRTLAEKRNFGVNNATGDLILQLDDDDFLLPEYLFHLNNAIEDFDWISIQKPILYYEDETKIGLYPVPLTNTFLYRRLTVAQQFKYEFEIEDEGITLNPFYGRVRKFFKGRAKGMLLKPEQCGYVWRQDVDARRKYSMVKYFNKGNPTPEETQELEKIEDIKNGDIYLTPKWEKDYVSIIKNNFKTLPLPKAAQTPFHFQMKNIIESSIKNSSNWKTVKPSWENATKFLSAAKSRGLIATATNMLGIGNTFGERVVDEIYQQRKESCFGNKEKNIDPCVRLRNIEKKGYFCGGCGCGSKDLARLDADSPDDYTKLHYPQLECPMKKKGFSNEEKGKLSVIITALNEDMPTLETTIKTLKDYSSNVEIIVIDDCSDVPVIVTDPSVKVYRNPERVGCAPSRTLGASKAKNEYLLFTDSHMIFHPNWYHAFLEYSANKPENVAFCGTCLGLDNENKDIYKSRGRYCGARLSLWEEKENQVLEGKWIEEKNEDLYELSAMMGALYFINREYFNKLRGLSELKMWGSDEPCLSLKILLSGGKILMAKNIIAGHIFRNVAPYSTNVGYLVYNKLRMAKTLLPDEMGDKLIDKLPKDGNFHFAIKLMEEKKEEVEEYKRYYQSIFTENIEDICQKFEIEYEI